MEYSNNLFIQLAIILSIASFFGYLAKLFKLPLLVAYLTAGVLLSFLKIFDFSNNEMLTTFPEIGVAFLLFFIGMELDLKEIKNLGKPIILGSIGQITISLTAGFLIASSFGFTPIESIFLGTALAFSSTVVVIKLLLEKKELNSLYGKLSMGILVLEDLIAITLLMGLTVGNFLFSMGIQSSFPILALLLKGGALLFLSLVLSKYFLERIFKAIAKSSELLFLTALSWCFIFVALSILFGFSVVIGAFLAGLALANSSFHIEIQGKVKPLRDFFVTLFFVYLGSRVVFQDVLGVLPLIIIFTLYALLVKPLIFLIILGSLGFKKHTIFQTAVNLSQISEFSLIVMMAGLSMGAVSQTALSAIALTGVLSITFSSINIASSRSLYNKLKRFVGFFERSKFTHQMERHEKPEVCDHVIIIGGHLMGGEIVRFLQKEKVPYLIVDFNPRVIQNLIDDGVPALYGDIGDSEIIEFLNLEKAKLIISTAPNVDDNLTLLTEARRKNVQAAVILRAATASDAETLYQAGADYVIMPEVVSGSFIAQILKNHWPNLEFFKSRSDIEIQKIARNHFALE